MTVRDIRAVEVFGLPMWEVELPEMRAHNDEIIALFALIIITTVLTLYYNFTKTYYYYPHYYPNMMFFDVF